MKTMSREAEELENIFCGNSQMANMLRSYNWDTSPLGPVSGWPESLKVSVRIMVTSAYPMFVCWGPDMIMLYNDGYMPLIGVKHPEALAQPAQIIWQEIWDKIGPMMEDVMQRGEAYFEEKSLFYIQRQYFKEETYYTYSYSPVFLPDGTVGGIFCACYENTLEVLTERRMSTISGISGTRTDISVEDSRREVMRALESNTKDIPFALLYTIENNDITLNSYTSAAFTLPLHNEPDLVNGSVFDLRKIESITDRMIPEHLRKKLIVPEHGMVPEQLVIIPVTDVGQQIIRGYLVIGLSAVLPYNQEYINFLMLLSSQVNSTVTAIRAFERERLLTQKLIELDKAKTAFFSNVSHEFRTPLTLILGPLEVLLSKADYLPEEDRVSLQIMQRNAFRLLKQVNTLLSFSNVEAGRYNVRFVPANIALATFELASTFQTIIEQAGLNYKINCRQVSEPVFIDIDMWEVVVLNLLSNAFKFTLSGSIEVLILEKERTVELHVADTGAGIPQHELPSLFNRFHRIEQPVRRTFEGSGIGLALVAELVKLNGGTIDVISEVGKGSRFIVSVPKGSAHLPKEKIYTGPAEVHISRELITQYQSEAEGWLKTNGDVRESINVEFTPPKSENRPTILLVEDNPDMLNYVQRLLATNYQVLTATNGIEALELLQHYKPDLILSDIMMPLMDGITLLNKLRSIPEFVTIPVILLSARAGEEDKFSGLQTGADDYIVKPFSARELITRISASIKNARLRNQLKEKQHQLFLESEQRKELLESILNSISDAFYHITPDLEFVYVNTRALEITRKTREEHIGRKVLDVYPYLEGSTLYTMILEALQTLQPVTMEYYDTELERWFDCRLYPAAEGSSAYFADITDRKLEEQARLETEKRFREVANAAPVLIWMAGADMGCDFLNEYWLEFRGRTLEEELDFGWAEGVHPDDRATCLELYSNYFKARKPFSMEYRLLNKDGEYRWILDNGVPRLTNDGQLLGFIGACTDITELKWAESLMSKYNNELAAEVALRTAELQKANDQLKVEIAEKVRKKRELMRSHEQLHLLTSHLQDLRENERKFIAREIHDELGQALTALKIEMLLLYDRLADSQSEYKDVMLESLESMEKALDESLVSMRKIISQLRPSLSDDLELVYEIQRLATDLEKRIGLSITVNSTVTKIELTPNLAIEVYRVIQESLTNVIKHANASEATIEISKENNKFKFLVKDNGIGFDENILQENKSFGILGIKERAQRIGASIAITTAKGHGTTVELLVSATLNKIDEV